MKLTRLRPVLVALLVISLVSIALARAAPTKEKVITDQAIVSVQAAPVIASVPPMTVGYDVICNLSTARQSASVDTSTQLRLSATVDWRNLQLASYRARSGPQPAMVLLT